MNDLIFLLLYFDINLIYSSSNNYGGFGGNVDNCHWHFKDFKVNCPKELDSWSDCVGFDIDLDTPRATRFLCGKTGYITVSWDIIPFDLSERIKDYYVVLGTTSDMCSDPMRRDPKYYTPIWKHWEKWYYLHKTTHMCISSETDINNRCKLIDGQLFIKYGNGLGCVLIYCDNLWDPCYLNINIKIDSKIWIQSKNITIKPWTNSITINGYGWDKICSRNILECYSGNGIKLSCVCYDVTSGSMVIHFDKPLMKDNWGQLQVSITTNNGLRIPPTVIGFVDFKDMNEWKNILYSELGLLSVGTFIGIIIFFILQIKSGYKLIEQKLEAQTHIKDSVLANQINNN